MTSRDDIRKRLADTVLFSGLAPRHLDRLAESVSRRTLPKRGILFHEGEPGRAMYILTAGRIQLHKTDPEGRETVIKILQPGESFAEVVLFEQNRYPVTALALAAAEVLEIDREVLRASLNEESFRMAFLGSLMGRLRYLTRRLAGLGSGDVRSRFRAFLREQYGAQNTIICDLARKDLAAAIGTTPETLSRLLLTLKREGRLTWKGRTITADPAFWDDEG